MKRAMSWCLMAGLVFGGLTLVGCSTTDDPGENGAYAGGNGEFGESSRSSGSYREQSHTTDSTAPMQNNNAAAH